MNSKNKLFFSTTAIMVRRMLCLFSMSIFLNIGAMAQFELCDFDYGDPHPTYGNPHYTISNVPGRPQSITVADMDNDGKQDVIVGGEWNRGWKIFKNNSTSGSFSFITIVSINATNFDSTIISTGSAGCPANGTPYTATGIQSSNDEIKVVDMNGDGVLDVIISGYTMSGTNVCFQQPVIRIYLNKGTKAVPSFLNNPDWQRVLNYSGGHTIIDVADINNDGFPDIAAQFHWQTFNRPIVFMNLDATGKNFSLPIPVGSTNWTDIDKQIRIANVDGGTDKEVLSMMRADSIIIAKKDVGNSFTKIANLPYDGLNLRYFNLYDLDGDLDLDLIAICKNAIFYQVNDGVGNFAGRVSLATSIGKDLSHCAFADFDKDGKNDLVVTQSSGESIKGTVQVYKNSSVPGTITFNLPDAFLTYPALLNPTRIDTSDFDMDGKMDFVVCHNKETQDAVAIYKNTYNTLLPPKVSMVKTTPGGYTLCKGTSISYTATPIIGQGPAPTYQWKINGTNVGTPQTITTFSTTNLSDKDTVTVMMTSNHGCVDPMNNPVISNKIGMTVYTTPAPTAPKDSSVCGNGLPQTLAATATVPVGTSLKWYDASTGGTEVALGKHTATSASIKTLYGEAKNSTTLCNSLTRTPVVLTINATPAAPSSASSVTLCETTSSQTLTASASVPAGINIVWYDSTKSGNIINPPTLVSTLATNKTLYSEAINVTSLCKSITRTPCLLRIIKANSGEYTSSVCSNNQIDLSLYLNNGDAESGWVDLSNSFSLTGPIFSPSGLKGKQYDFSYKSICSSDVVLVHLLMDTDKPIIECSPTFNATPDATGNYTFKETDLEVIKPKVEDKCGYKLSNSLNNDSTLLGSTLKKSEDITWTAVDNLGNTSTCVTKAKIEDVVISNILTPNGDEKNDYWIIVLQSNQKVVLYNRWGQIVKELSGANVQWDGTLDNGKLAPIDSYIFQVLDGSSVVRKGFISVVY